MGTLLNTLIPIGSCINCLTKCALTVTRAYLVKIYFLTTKMSLKQIMLPEPIWLNVHS